MFYQLSTINIYLVWLRQGAHLTNFQIGNGKNNETAYVICAGVTTFTMAIYSTLTSLFLLSPLLLLALSSSSSLLLLL